jgi:hypothetical protein
MEGENGKQGPALARLGLVEQRGIFCRFPTGPDIRRGSEGRWVGARCCCWQVETVNLVADL